MDYVIREMRNEEFGLLGDFCTRQSIFQTELNHRRNQ